MDISNLISTLSEASASLSAKNELSEEQRLKLHEACEGLSGRLATPGEHLMKTSSGVGDKAYGTIFNYTVLIAFLHILVYRACLGPSGNRKRNT
jgi:hypothetical protein